MQVLGSRPLVTFTTEKSALTVCTLLDVVQQI